MRGVAVTRVFSYIFSLMTFVLFLTCSLIPDILALPSGIVELTHNHGTESDPNFAGYHSGNKDPRGFGHIAITVPNVEEACARLEKLGVPFQKKLTDGRMRHIAFALDPDG